MTPNKTPIPTTPLPAIPLVDIGNSGPVALFESELARADEIVRLGREQYGTAVIGFLDHVSKNWTAFAGNPHIDEIRHMAGQVPPGIWFMNLCLEWACTNGVMNDPTAPGMRLLRTLDWPFNGLGRNLMVAKQEGPAGTFLNLTWPGFSGTVQGMAPGRFALALNQAPLVRHLSLPVYVDWLLNRIKVFSSKPLDRFLTTPNNKKAFLARTTNQPNLSSPRCSFVVSLFLFPFFGRKVFVVCFGDVSNEKCICQFL